MILQADEAVVVTAHDEFVDTLPNGVCIHLSVSVLLDVPLLQARLYSVAPGTSG